MSARYLRISQVARQLGLCSKTVLRQVRRGSIPGGEALYAFDGRKGTRWLVRREVFEPWLADVQNVPNIPK